MKRILIAAALCLVSFQSYAESEMTFKEFGDVIYSEDQSAYFMRYTDTAVNKQKVMKALRYSAGTYGDANGFRDACLAKCAGEEKCGGVVFQYYKTDKKTPKKCAFKKLEPTTKTNKQKKKDFYRRVCYVGGPGGFLSPEDGSSNPVICRLFGKNVVELADGSFIVVEKEPEGEGTNVLGDASSGGGSITERFPPGTLWTTVVAAGAHTKPKKFPLTPCWCHGARDKANYCKAEGWVVGKNKTNAGVRGNAGACAEFNSPIRDTGVCNRTTATLAQCVND